MERKAASRQIRTKVAGVSFRNNDRTSRQANIKNYCSDGDPLYVLRERHNPHGSTATSLWVLTSKGYRQVGYIGGHLSAEVAEHIDGGLDIDVRILQVTGGDDDEYFGVNIEISLLDTPPPHVPAEVDA